MRGALQLKSFPRDSFAADRLGWNWSRGLQSMVSTHREAALLGQKSHRAALLMEHKGDEQ